jgi:transcriptional regulator with XRE-family HTH domain
MVSKLRMDIRKVFGANVRRHRISADLSQAAVADRMGVDRAYISMIERGGQNATLISILEVAEALRVHPSVLLMEVEQEVDTDESTKPRPAEPGGVDCDT